MTNRKKKPEEKSCVPTFNLGCLFKKLCHFQIIILYLCLKISADTTSDVHVACELPAAYGKLPSEGLAQWEGEHAQPDCKHQ